MLDITLDKNILTVVETIHSFTNSKVTYWYVDINTWRKSITGKKDAPIERDMTESDIEWCQKYHLPKAKVVTNESANR